MNFQNIYALPLKTIIIIMILVLIIWTIISILINTFASNKLQQAWSIINIVVSLISIFVICYATIISRVTNTEQLISFIRTSEDLK